MDYQTILQQLDNEIELKRNEQNMSREKIKELFREKHGDYWYISEIDTWINIDVTKVPALDKVNKYILFKISSFDVEQSYDVTLFGVNDNIKPYTIEEYHNKYCVKDIDNNRWIFNENNLIDN